MRVAVFNGWLKLLLLLIVSSQLALVQHYYFKSNAADTYQNDAAMQAKIARDKRTETTHSIDLVFMGDIMLDRSIGRGILNDVDPFMHVRGELSKYDVRIGNIETTIAALGVGAPANKAYRFNSPLESLDTLKSAGMNISSLANNHTGDYGRAATADTIKQFEKAGLKTVGAGMDIEQAFEATFIESRGIKVAFIGVNDIELAHTKVTDTKPGSAYLDEELIAGSIADAKEKGADFVVVLPHWGIEYSPVQSPHQAKWARIMIDNGADLVVGGHPHVVQPTETYKGKQIVYSLGNFIFDGMSGDALNGQMISLQLTKTEVTSGERILESSFIAGDVASIKYSINSQGFPVINAN